MDKTRDVLPDLLNRESGLHLTPDQFRDIGYALVDALTQRISQPETHAVRPEVDNEFLRDICNQQALPQRGESAESVFARTTQWLCDNAVSTSHSGFFAYIMGAASPVSALADFLASAISPPMTSYSTSPLSTVMEAQTVRWMAELLGYPNQCGGLFVSGGSMANLLAIKAALGKLIGFEQARSGLADLMNYRIYTSGQAHSSVVAAAEICGLGSAAVVTVLSTATDKLDTVALARKIDTDKRKGLKPLMVVGIAGCTSLGIVDPLPEIARICRDHHLWFHVDGAYGGVAILASQAPEDLKGLREADSVTIDPHKWLYVAADVGCLLTKDPDVLFKTFKQGGAYYSSDDNSGQPATAAKLQFRDFGPQTTRSFRALKVRMSLEIAGCDGIQHNIQTDIMLAEYLFKLADEHELLEACTQNLSICTLRFVPDDQGQKAHCDESRLNDINKKVLEFIQHEGRTFPSHTWYKGKFLIRVCIVNLNTCRSNIELLVQSIVQAGVRLHNLSQSS